MVNSAARNVFADPAALGIVEIVGNLAGLAALIGRELANCDIFTNWSCASQTYCVMLVAEESNWRSALWKQYVRFLIITLRCAA